MELELKGRRENSQNSLNSQVSTDEGLFAQEQWLHSWRGGEDTEAKVIGLGLRIWGM